LSAPGGSGRGGHDRYVDPTETGSGVKTTRPSLPRTTGEDGVERPPVCLGGHEEGPGHRLGPTYIGPRHQGESAVLVHRPGKERGTFFTPARRRVVPTQSQGALEEPKDALRCRFLIRLLEVGSSPQVSVLQSPLGREELTEPPQRFGLGLGMDRIGELQGVARNLQPARPQRPERLVPGLRSLHHQAKRLPALSRGAPLSLLDETVVAVVGALRPTARPPSRPLRPPQRSGSCPPGPHHGWDR
jgi:hypothetical protein